MGRLLRFFEWLTAEKFYGSVTLKFKDGKLAGPVKVERDYLEENLPQHPGETPVPSRIPNPPVYAKVGAKPGQTMTAAVRARDREKAHNWMR